VAGFVRNRWPLSIGLGGRFPSESVAALPRIPQTSKHAKQLLGQLEGSRRSLVNVLPFKLIHNGATTLP
jgi:hypothetical protein